MVKYYPRKLDDGTIVNVYRFYDDEKNYKSPERYRADFRIWQPDENLVLYKRSGDIAEYEQISEAEALEIIKKLDEEYAAMKATQKKE